MSDNMLNMTHEKTEFEMTKDIQLQVGEKTISASGSGMSFAVHFATSQTIAKQVNASFKAC